MPSLDPRKMRFRARTWEIIDECSACDLERCPEWCREFVSCQLDDIFDDSEGTMRQESRFPA